MAGQNFSGLLPNGLQKLSVRQSQIIIHAKKCSSVKITDKYLITKKTTPAGAVSVLPEGKLNSGCGKTPDSAPAG